MQKPQLQPFLKRDWLPTLFDDTKFINAWRAGQKIGGSLIAFQYPKPLLVRPESPDQTAITGGSLIPRNHSTADAATIAEPDSLTRPAAPEEPGPNGTPDHTPDTAATLMSPTRGRNLDQ